MCLTFHVKDTILSVKSPLHMQRMGVKNMEALLAALARSPLFAGIAERELPALLDNLGAREVSATQGVAILGVGDLPDHVGVVLEGELQVVRDDAQGGRALLTTLWPGDYYGEALACAGVEHSPVSVVAAAPSRVLRIPFAKLQASGGAGGALQCALIWNLAGIIAKKNLMLQRRMELLEKKSIRERVLGYLAAQMPPSGRAFTVPMNRSELASYLAVDRSALSRELGRLRDESVIRYEGNRFELLSQSSR